jgi:hypothetical protein
MIDFAAHMETVALALFDNLNRAQSTKKGLRFGTNGSLSIDLEKGTWYDFETTESGGVLDLIKRQLGLTGRDAIEWMREQGCDIESDATSRAKRGNGSNGGGPQPAKHIVARFPYPDETGTVLFEVLRYHFTNADGTPVLDEETGKPTKTFRQRRPDPTKHDGWNWSVKGVRVIPYRLDELVAVLRATPGSTVYVAEGEGKVDALTKWDLTATCNAMGASNWTKEHAAFLRGAAVIVVADNDAAGRAFVELVAESLKGVATSIRVLLLPGLSPKGDLLDWIAAGGTKEQFLALAEQADPYENEASVLPQNISLDDFRAYMPLHNYLYLPTREPWPAASVDARLGTIPIINADGVPKKIKASRWLDQNKPVEQATWAPGLPMLIENRLIAEGGWIDQPKTTILNLYRPPRIILGDPDKADPWLDHVRKVYPADAAHIIRWLAHRREDQSRARARRAARHRQGHSARSAQACRRSVEFHRGDAAGAARPLQRLCKSCGTAHQRGPRPRRSQPIPVLRTAEDLCRRTTGCAARRREESARAQHP